MPADPTDYDLSSPHSDESSPYYRDDSDIRVEPVDIFEWNPLLEINPTEIVETGQEEAPSIVDAEGNRIRMPPERDNAVLRELLKYRAYLNSDISVKDFITYIEEYNGPSSLQYMNFENANFTGFDFSGLDLTGTSFFGCVLQDAKFVNCILKNTNFQWADLIFVNFTTAKFEGDYAAGGLFEGATILECNFDGATFNGLENPAAYNKDTLQQPYDPKLYPLEDQLSLPEGTPNTINTNANGRYQTEQEDRIMKIKPFIEEKPTNFVFRVVDVNGSYTDYLLELDYINSFLEGDKSTVYPCRKPFNVPGPSYPSSPNEISYHDIKRPIINVGNMIQRRVFVLKDKFLEALQVAKDNRSKGFVFFKNETSETVPTFVSHPVLFNRASWVGELHCNSGAERETLSYVKMIDMVEGEEPIAIEEEPTAEPNAFGEEASDYIDISGSESDYEHESSAAAFQGDYIDPYAGESDSDTESDIPAPVNIVYNPPVENKTVNIGLPDALDINTATGKVARLNPATNSIVVIPMQKSFKDEIEREVTTTITLSVTEGEGFDNYIIKFNDVIQVLKENNKDAVPCKTTINPSINDLDISRRFINIGAIINKVIYIDKRQLIDLLPNDAAVQKATELRSFVLQYNAESEMVPGITPWYFDRLLSNKCQGPIKVWDLQHRPNNIPEDKLIFKGKLPVILPLAERPRVFPPGTRVEIPSVGLDGFGVYIIGIIVDLPEVGELYYPDIRAAADDITEIANDDEFPIGMVYFVKIPSLNMIDDTPYLISAEDIILPIGTSISVLVKNQDWTTSEYDGIIVPFPKANEPYITDFNTQQLIFEDVNRFTPGQEYAVVINALGIVPYVVNVGDIIVKEQGPPEQRGQPDPYDDLYNPIGSEGEEQLLDVGTPVIVYSTRDVDGISTDVKYNGVIVNSPDEGEEYYSSIDAANSNEATGEEYIFTMSGTKYFVEIYSIHNNKIPFFIPKENIKTEDPENIEARERILKSLGVYDKVILINTMDGWIVDPPNVGEQFTRSLVMNDASEEMTENTEIPPNTIFIKLKPYDDDGNLPILIPFDYISLYPGTKVIINNPVNNETYTGKIIDITDIIDSISENDQISYYNINDINLLQTLDMSELEGSSTGSIVINHIFKIGREHYFVKIGTLQTPVLVPLKYITIKRENNDLEEPEAEEEASDAEAEGAEVEAEGAEGVEAVEVDTTANLGPAEAVEEIVEIAEEASLVGGSKKKHHNTLRRVKHHHYNRNTLRKNHKLHKIHAKKTHHHLKRKKYNQLTKRNGKH